MKKNVTDILDIHTHKQEVDTQGKSIINYPLLADSPLYMPLAENVEVAVGRGSYYSIGIHPWEVRESNVSQQLSFLQQQLQRKQFVAVGEAGLDKLAKAPMELQLAVFKEQVKLSEKLGLPLIIHCVKAMEELLGVKKESRPQQPWIWHGFRGKPEQAVQLLKRAFISLLENIILMKRCRQYPTNGCFWKRTTVRLILKISCVGQPKCVG